MAQEESKNQDISLIQKKLDSGTYSQISRMLNKLNPADIALFIESSPPKNRLRRYHL